MHFYASQNSSIHSKKHKFLQNNNQKNPKTYNENHKNSKNHKNSHRNHKNSNNQTLTTMDLTF